MIYELKKWNNPNEKLVQMAKWETDKDAKNGVCGKLLKYKGFIEEVEGKKILAIPDGVATIATSTFVGKGPEDKKIDKFIIPASVKELEEGALGNIFTEEIYISPDSKCAIIKGKGVYSIDEKTLLYYFGEYSWDEKITFVVPNGVTRIGEEAFWGGFNLILELPDSINEIWYEETNLLGKKLKADLTYTKFTIRAHKNSFAAKFAKKNSIKLEEI